VDGSTLRVAAVHMARTVEGANSEASSTGAGLDARPRPTATKAAHLDPASRPAKRSSTSAHKRTSTTRQQAGHMLGHQRHQVHHGRVGHQAAPQSTLAADLPQWIGAVLRHLDDALHYLLRIGGVRLSL
jgi:hypothetical protein